MKKYLTILLLLGLFVNVYGQNWVNVTNQNPVTYGFSFPGAATTLDTFNIRYYYNKPDSATTFMVMELKEAPFDSTNTVFNMALQQNGGDTLMAMAQTINSSTNSVLTGSQDITTYPAYKGLEVNIKYNATYQNRVVVCYSRFFYNHHNTLLLFSVTGFEDNLQQLTMYKNSFFNSIVL